MQLQTVRDRLLRGETVLRVLDMIRRASGDIAWGAAVERWVVDRESNPEPLAGRARALPVELPTPNSAPIRTGE